MAVSASVFNPFSEGDPVDLPYLTGQPLTTRGKKEGEGRGVLPPIGEDEDIPPEFLVEFSSDGDSMAHVPGIRMAKEYCLFGLRLVLQHQVGV